MDPAGVGQMIEKNFGGVRIDGTNATIIGEGDGNFIADRNGIARVWMDHALWPQMTVKLYIDQTGDVAVLDRQAPYFKDAQAMRGTRIDPDYQPGQGCCSAQPTGRSIRAPSWSTCLWSSWPPSMRWAAQRLPPAGRGLERRIGHGRCPR